MFISVFFDIQGVRKIHLQSNSRFLQRNKPLDSYRSVFSGNRSADTPLPRLTDLILNGAGNEKYFQIRQKKGFTCTSQTGLFSLH